MCVETNSSSLAGSHGNSRHVHTAFHVIPEGEDNPVNCVTSLADDVFVVRRDSRQKIEAYDSINFRLQRHITVSGLGDRCFGLAACPYSNCLYASSYYENSVHRVNLSRGNAVMGWSVASHPYGLSVNSEHSLIVVSGPELKLQIFTTHGNLLQDIRLQPDIEDLCYAVQAVQLPTTSQFLISHWGSLHRVWRVGVDGAVLRSYGAHEGSELRQMKCPSGLAVDSKGRVLVADSFNDRLFVINPSLTSAHELPVNVDGGLDHPFSLWYDQTRRRLCISEMGGESVIVISNVKDFAAHHL